MRIRNAEAADVDALAALWSQAFTPPLTPGQWLLDEERFAHTLVAADEAGVCGSIHGLPKRLRESGGGAARVHCIGSVAVAERARGAGLARRLIRASLKTADDADWALLFTGTPGVYASSGFSSLSMERVVAGPWHPPVLASAQDAVERLIVTPGTLAELGEVYERTREGRVCLAPVRAARDWAMAEVRLRGERLYLRRGPSGRPEGYAIASVRAGTGRLVEYAVPPDAASAERTGTALLAAIADDWSVAGVSDCELAVAQLPEDETVLGWFAPRARRQEERTGMVRPLRRAPRLDCIRHLTEADYF